MAVKMYTAGSTPGMLSRKAGENMASYVLRRETWWTQLQELDSEVKCSTAILGEQLLTQAGLTHLEQQLTRSVMHNDLGDLKKLGQTLRDQFGSVHNREWHRKGGKGDHRGRRFPWNFQSSAYMVDTPGLSPMSDDSGTTEYYDAEEDYAEEHQYDGRMTAWRPTTPASRRSQRGSLSKAFMLRRAVPSPDSRRPNVATPSLPTPRTSRLDNQRNRRSRRQCWLPSNGHAVDNKGIGRGIGSVPSGGRNYKGKRSSKGKDKNKSPGKGNSSLADSPMGSTGSA